MSGRLFVGGHSYGGRMASMIVAEDAARASGLLLQSYPLHPPGKPADVRTEHLPRIRVPALFVHGTTDPFGATQELDAARALIPARTVLLSVNAGHDLGWGSKTRDHELPEKIATAFLELVSSR